MLLAMKTAPEVFHFCFHVRTPWDFTLQHLLLGVDVEKFGSLSEEEHAAPTPETLLFVQDTLLENQVAINKPVILVVLLL